MTVIASRDLRNHTASVLERVREGDSITITVNGAAVAELVPLRGSRPTFMSRDEFLAMPKADPGLRSDLEQLAGDTTDDLG